MTYQTEFSLSRLARWTLLCALMGLAMAPAARATEPLYEVNSSVAYVIPPDTLPPIDATTFFVNYAALFSVDIDATDGLFSVFETYNTLNYTNYGTIEVNTSFQFDTQVTNAFGTTEHLMASNFYNPGYILCGSTNELYPPEGLPECIVNAANVVNNNGGTLDVGQNGLIQITGQNVDLGAGVLSVEGNGLGSIQAIPGDFSGVYIAGSGVDTNNDWNPGTDLTASSATPSLVEIGYQPPANPPTAIWDNPFDYFGTPTLATTPYFEETQQPGTTNDFIYRYVFVENFETNVTFNVFINGQLGSLSGSGAAAVEFTGNYTNPVTGALVPEYLYVRDDYVQGGITNVPINNANHIPNNFTFESSFQPLIGGTGDTPNFLEFPDGILTNTYSYADVECIPTTVLTNSTSFENSNYLANIAGSIQVNASSNLNLSGVQIFDQNYLSLAVSNQLDGVAGANILSPYSNFNVAATNLSLMVTNLLEPTTPAWSGYLGAWSTRFFVNASNSVITFSNGVPTGTNTTIITNDYRVLIVCNFASPGSPSSVWNLQVRDTNNVSISDVYNILYGLNLNCTSLTLTTNVGSPGSPYGELNLSDTADSSFNWASATPNLHFLTNNGVILLPNEGVFGSPTAPYGALINSGLIEDLGSQIWTGNFVDTGSFLNYDGSFILDSQTATATNCTLAAEGDLAITTDDLTTSNLFLEGDRSLTLAVTNFFTDDGVSNGSIWIVGDASIGNGLQMPLLPASSSLLGTSIYDYAPTNRTTRNVWPGVNFGASNQGYTNNAAVGQLILDPEGTGPLTQLSFSGTDGAGATNAIYVDRLVLTGGASYTNHVINGRGTNAIPSLGFNNLIIYYADAISPTVYGDASLQDVSFQINGFNNNHLRWVPTYVGYFSGTNIVYPNGTTNRFNAGLAESAIYDSDGAGSAGDPTYNVNNPTPFFVSSEMGMAAHLTNSPAKSVAISWNTVPFATNFVYYSTNLLSWQLLTNSYSPTNAWFVTPTPNPGPATNITILDPITGQQKFYQITVSPDLLYPYQ